MAQTQPDAIVYEEVPAVDAATAATQMAGLRDVSVPGPPSWLPQTAGWYVLAGLVLAGLVWLAWRLWRRWEARAYRRAALAELDRLSQQLAVPASRAAAIRRINELVKRVRLSHDPRAEVAALSGPPWLASLDHTWRGPSFTNAPGMLLADVAYEDDPHVLAVQDAEVHELVVVVRNWIRGHRA